MAKCCGTMSLVILVAITMRADVRADDRGLFLETAVGPAPVVEGKSLTLRATFVNRGEREIRLFVPRHAGLEPFPTWRLTSEPGEVFAPCPRSFGSGPSPENEGEVVVLAAGGRRDFRTDVDLVVVVGKDGRLDLQTPCDLPAGRYGVTCEYRHDDGRRPVSRENLFAGTLRAKELTLVVPPSPDPSLRISAPNEITAGDPFAVEITVRNPANTPLRLRGWAVATVFWKPIGAAEARFSLQTGAPIEKKRVEELTIPPRSSPVFRVDLEALSFVSIARDSVPMALFDLLPSGSPDVAVRYESDTGKCQLQSISIVRTILDRAPGAASGLRLVARPHPSEDRRAPLIELVLVNESKASIRVVRRLSFPADVCLAIEDPSGARPARCSVALGAADRTGGGHAVVPGREAVLVEGLAWDAERFEKPGGLSPADFVLVAPGEALSRVLDPLLLIHGGLPPGRYQVRAFWRCLDSGRRLGIVPPPATIGVLSSTPILLDVPP